MAIKVSRPAEIRIDLIFIVNYNCAMSNRRRYYFGPPLPNNQIHYHWASITRVGTYRAPLYELDQHGNPYVADNAGGPWMWQLECDCGYRWEIQESDFPGKRKLRSCGREECKYTPRAAVNPVTKEHGVSISVYMEMDVFQGMTAYADEQKLNFSRAVNQMCRQGLIAKLTE